MAVLQNYIILKENEPARMHFVNHAIEKKIITDRKTGNPVKKATLVFDVDRLDREPVEAQYSIISEKLASKFEPYLKDKSYRDFEFVITVQGQEFTRDWTVEKIPLAL